MTRGEEVTIWGEYGEESGDGGDGGEVSLYGRLVAYRRSSGAEDSTR